MIKNKKTKKEKRTRKNVINRKGFTLVELLVVIAVLAVVLSIVMYFATNTINEAKKKTYVTTVNNIERAAGNYIVENSDKMFFTQDAAKEGEEHQCVSVKELVDYGYLSNDVVKSLNESGNNIKMSDLVFITRNRETQAITQNKYLGKDAQAYQNICRSMKVSGGVTVTSNPSGWSNEKTVTIKYEMKETGNDEGVALDYVYNYKFTDVDGNVLEVSSATDKDKFITKEDGSVYTEFKVRKDGEVYTEVKLDENSIVSGTGVINGIDLVGPYVKGSNTKKTISETVSIPLTVLDDESGIEKGTFTVEDIDVKVGNIDITDISLSNPRDCKTVGNAIRECIYDLTITNNKYNGSVSIKIEDKSISDSVDNWNNEQTINTNITFDNSYKITLDGNGATISGTSSVKVYYGSSTISPATLTLPEKRHTVKYNANGTGIKMPNDASIENTFTGWYSAKENGVKVINNDRKPSFIAGVENYTNDSKQWLVTNNTTLYANWDSGVLILPALSKKGFDCNWREGSKKGSKFGPGESRPISEDITYYADCVDSTRPNANITSTSNLKTTEQTVTLKCSDNVGVVSYYWSTTAPSDSSSFTTVESTKSFTITKKITSAGKYYFACKDNDNNNSETEEIELFSYNVYNMLNDTNHDEGTYSEANYSQYQDKNTYLAPKGTKISYSSVYTIPVGSNVNKFKGMSDGAPSNTAVTVNTKERTLTSNNQNYTMWFNRNRVRVKINVNGGKLASKHGAAYAEYAENNHYITKDGSIYIQILKYGGVLPSTGLPDCDKENYINIEKPGYVAKSGQEWFKKNSDNTKTYFSQSSTSISINSLCNAVDDDCNVVLYVNWIDNTPPVVTVKLLNGSTDASSYLNSENWFKFNPTIKYTVTDAGSGLAGTATLYWNEPGKSTLSKTIHNTSGESCATSGSSCKWNNGVITRNISSSGYRYLKLHVCDKDNNCTDKEISFKLDNQAPTKPDITNPTRGNWVNYNFKLQTSTTESLSGVDHWYYSYAKNPSGVGTNNNTQWIKYTNSTGKANYETNSFTAERGQYVYLRVCDVAGNCSPTAQSWIAIDKTPPSLGFEMYNGGNKISQTSSGKKNYYVTTSPRTSDTDAQWLSYYPNLKFITSDSGCGIDKDSQKFGYNQPGQSKFDGKLKSSDGKITNYTATDSVFTYSRAINSAGNRYIYFRICDRAGNCSDNHVYFKILNAVNATKYDCKYYSDNTFRARIMNVTSCQGETCNYNKLNGLSTSANFSLDVNNPISWTIPANDLKDELAGTCAFSYYIVNNQKINCYNGASTSSGVKTTVSSNCKKLESYKTTTKVNNSGDNWYYIPEKSCYISGSYLTSSTPSACYPASSSTSSSSGSPSGNYYITLNTNGGLYYDHSSGYRTYSYSSTISVGYLLNQVDRVNCTPKYVTVNGVAKYSYLDWQESGKVANVQWECGGFSYSCWHCEKPGYSPHNYWSSSNPNSHYCGAVSASYC